VVLLGPDFHVLGLVQEHEVAYDEAMRLCISPFVAIVLHLGFRLDVALLCLNHILLGFALGLVPRQAAVVWAFEKQIRWRSVRR
jgi:hypothetical protein